MVLERFSSLYRSLTTESVDKLGDVYAPNALLVDPIGSHEGLDAIKHYFANLLENNQSCQFVIERQTLNDNQGFVVWTMIYQHPKLASGATLKLNGISELRTEHDLIVYQRDYYDLGEMIYEHIPMLGFVVRKIKQRLKGI